MTPEAALGGVLARVQDGDLITVDAERGFLELDVSDAGAALRASPPAAPRPARSGSAPAASSSPASAPPSGAADTGASVFPALQPYDFSHEENRVAEHI